MDQGFDGTAHGNRIELDQPLPLSDGTRVRVVVSTAPEPHCGSPSAVLQLVGTLSAEEAKAIDEVVTGARTIDPALWQ